MGRNSFSGGFEEDFLDWPACHSRPLSNLWAVCHNNPSMVRRIKGPARKIYVGSRKKTVSTQHLIPVQKRSFHFCRDQGQVTQGGSRREKRNF
jgi:hypothetical protein